MHASEFWSPRPRSHEQFLRELAAAAASPVWRHLRALTAARPRLRSIELGCGLGKLSLLMGLLGHEVTFLDSNAGALAQIRDFLDSSGIAGTVLSGDLLKLPSDLHGQFDVSLSVGTIEHFVGNEERLRAVTAHAGVLRPGGLTLIAVPNRLGLYYRPVFGLRRLAGYWPRDVPEIPYSARELKVLGRRAGLAGTEVRGLAPLSEDFRDWIVPSIESLGRKLIGYPRKRASPTEQFSLSEIAQMARDAPRPACPRLGYPFSAGIVMTGSKPLMF